MSTNKNINMKEWFMNNWGFIPTDEELAGMHREELELLLDIANKARMYQRHAREREKEAADAIKKSTTTKG